jgi:hypothetical protein
MDFGHVSSAKYFNRPIVTYFLKAQIKNELLKLLLSTNHRHIWVVGIAHFGTLRTRFINKKTKIGVAGITRIRLCYDKIYLYLEDIAMRFTQVYFV